MRPGALSLSLMAWHARVLARMYKKARMVIEAKLCHDAVFNLAAVLARDLRSEYVPLVPRLAAAAARLLGDL